MKYQRSSSVLRKRNLTIFGAIALAAAVGLGVTAASAHGGRHGRPRPPGGTASPTPTNSPSGAQTISCPDVAGALPAVPAASQAEVTSNLALLQKQIAEANQRLATSAGQG